MCWVQSAQTRAVTIFVGAFLFIFLNKESARSWFYIVVAIESQVDSRKARLLNP